jgi:tetratricopeptide (TPR) repeat protein
LPDRPGIGGGNRPSLPDRPGIGGGNRHDRPSFPDRPIIGGGNNSNNNNNNNIIINGPNRPIDRPIRPPNRPIYINNRPININLIRPGSRPWFDYHYHHWHRGYWSWWRPAGWFVGGVAAGWMLAPSQPIIVFNNPFYDKSVTVFNYSQGLPPPVEDPVNDAQSLDTAESAIEIFGQSREAFMTGDYKTALALVDKAIKELPTDATLHEFRALCLFALKDYRQSAATLYAVLAAGPGWDWDTMHALFPDVATYTEQLRTLEAYQRANPKSAEASFVLAYHYLVLGHVDTAIRQLENVVKLLPDSQLSAELLAALKVESSPPSPG